MADIPARRPDQSLDDHQAEVAAWVGCSVERLNAEHDRTHEALCDWIGVPSHSLACARGEDHDADAAWKEEAVVMHLQRMLAHHDRTIL